MEFTLSTPDRHVKSDIFTKLTMILLLLEYYSFKIAHESALQKPRLTYFMSRYTHAENSMKITGVPY